MTDVAIPQDIDSLAQRAQPADPERANPTPDPRPSFAEDPPEAFWLEPLRRFLSSDRTASLVVLALGALMFLPRLGSMGLWDPWETHYGEVAREMIVRDDYVYPHWESAYFFSKPPLPMWMMALGMLLSGAEAKPIGEALGPWTEWGVRLPFAMMAIAALWAVYRIGSQLRDRATGVLSAFVLAGSAQFVFIGKQAMVDMPLVACLTVGLALFCKAVFDPEVDEAGADRAPRRLRVGAGLAVLLGTLPQLGLILRETSSWGARGALLGVSLLGALAAAYLFVAGRRRACYLAGFYVLAGFACLAKGPAALYVLGPLVLLYVVLTADAHVLWRSWLIPGGLVFLLVAVPWFLTLSLFDGRDDEGKTFVGRFWIHDTFNRLGRGVHGDRPTFGYYIEQLAYGMWPWSALVPFAIGWAGRASVRETGVPRRRLLTVVLIWAVWSYVAFSISKTGFHHYILPAVPAIAILVAYWIRWTADAPERRLGGYLSIPLLGLMVVAARDLINDPQHLSNLFTYKYDRAYPRDVRKEAALFQGVLLSVGIALMVVPVALGEAYRNARLQPFLHRVFVRLRVPKLGAWLGTQGRAVGLCALIAVGVVFSFWISHYHFNMLAQHWSQAHMFETYFKEKKGDEPIYAYQLNWRGETFYSRNTVIQVKEAGANQRMRALVDQPGREFIVVEQSRFHTLKNLLSADKKERIRILDKSSIKFYLCVVD